jgi:hypothetical protein
VGTITSHRIVVILGTEPAVDIHPIAARAVKEGCNLTLLTLGRRLTAAQEGVIEEVAHLAWSSMESLSYGIAYGIEAIDDGDEIIIAAAGSERRALQSSLESRLQDLKAARRP